MPRPRALLFDLDGTMVETDPLHLKVFNVLLEQNGKIAVDFEYYKKNILGKINSNLFPFLFPEKDAATLFEMGNLKEQMFRDMVGETRLEPVAGLITLLDWAKENGVSCAIVTNAMRPNADLMIKSLGLEGRFDALVIGEELPHGKPHPLPYLTALAEFGCAAAEAFAFEDSLSGLRAAVAAGIPTFGMDSSLPAETLRAAGAVEVLKNFEDGKLWERLGGKKHLISIT